VALISDKDYLFLIFVVESNKNIYSCKYSALNNQVESDGYD